MTVLLKTALVWVSSIQIMQVRRKAVAKCLEKQIRFGRITSRAEKLHLSSAQPGDKHWQSWWGLIFLCSFSVFPGNGARKLLYDW